MCNNLPFDHAVVSLYVVTNKIDRHMMSGLAAVAAVADDDGHHFYYDCGYIFHF